MLNLENSREDFRLARDILAPHVARSRARCTPALQSLRGTPALAPGSVAVLVAEPFSRACEGLVCDAQLWQHWAQVEALRDFLDPRVIFVPRRFRIRAVLLSCRELWRRRQPVDAKCAGVDVAAINRLHPDSSSSRSATGFRERFPCGLWQVDHSVVSDAVTLCDVALDDRMPRRKRRFDARELHAREASRGVQAIATWTEIEASEGRWISTASLSGSRFRPCPSLQGVLLARHPSPCTDVLEQSHGGRLLVQVSARFDPRDGSFQVSASWGDGMEF